MKFKSLTMRLSKTVIIFCFRVCSENLALGKPVWEQYPWPGPEDYGSENAVDGLYSTRIASGGQCTLSASGKLTATLRVDLGSVASISHINIYYRTGNLKYVLLYKNLSMLIHLVNTIVVQRNNLSQIIFFCHIWTILTNIQIPVIKDN